MFERLEAMDALLPAHFDDRAPARRHLRAVLRALGAKVTGGPPAEPGDGPHTLVVFTRDRDFASTVYAVPDEALTPRLREALTTVPECFAAPDDAYLSSWGDVLRLLAVWDLDGLSAADFHDVMVEDFGARHGHRDLPDLEELTRLGNTWAGHAVLTVEHFDEATAVDAAAPWLGHHYTSMYAFRQSM